MFSLFTEKERERALGLSWAFLARPKFWPESHKLGIVQLDSGQILGGPTQPDHQKLPFLRKNWSKLYLQNGLKLAKISIPNGPVAK